MADQPDKAQDPPLPLVGTGWIKHLVVELWGLRSEGRDTPPQREPSLVEWLALEDSHTVAIFVPFSLSKNLV